MISKYPQSRKDHWEKVYTEKDENQVSWFQEKPVVSLEWIQELQPEPDSRVLDVGGGDSRLVDHLLSAGYRDITVLDISSRALDRSKSRLGTKGEAIHWMEADAVNITMEAPVDLWHDRAAFHFLTEEADIRSYVRGMKKGIKPGGHAIIATFSKAGPTRCSGIPVQQYAPGDLEALLAPEFELLRSRTMDHETPSGNSQNFLFTAFRRKS